MRKIFKRILIILILVLVSISLTSCSEDSSINSYALCRQMNEIITEYSINGKKEEIEDKWYSTSTSGKTFDYDSLTGDNGTVTVGTLGTDEPFAYFYNGSWTGICFEYIYELCYRNNYNLDIDLYSDPAALIAAVSTGKVDITAGALSITEERMESVSFSKPYFTNQVVCIVKKDNTEISSKLDLKGKSVGVLTGTIIDKLITDDCSTADVKRYNSHIDYITALENGQLDAAYIDSAVYRYYEDSHPAIKKVYIADSDDKYGFIFQKFGYQSANELEGTTVGIMEGSIYGEFAEKAIKNANMPIYKDIPSMIIALQTNKIDTFVCDKSLVNEAMKSTKSLYIFEDALASNDTGAAFPKTEEGLTRKLDFDSFISELKESGELERLITKWENYEEGVTILDPSIKFSGATVTLTVSINALMSPYIFMENNKYTGLEIEIMNKYAESRGINLVYENMEWSSLIPSLSKNDMAISCINITEERAQSVYFSTPIYPTEIVFVSMSNYDRDLSFFDSIGNSFYKTFVKEDRWKLFVEGIGVTLLISMSSVLIGLIFGCGLYLLSEELGKPFKTFMKAYNAILNFIPIVVILMIFYYVIFGHSSISGIVVSIIVFSLLFSSSTFTMLQTCVKGIDKGQYEAAYALGYSKTKMFFRIVLPQTLKQFIPMLRSEIVTHLKATAIVGYVAVEDLTKMSDIVRSRTYESFFPLVATALIYFLLAYLLIKIIKRINLSFDSKSRNVNKFLKGVEIHD